MDARYGAPPAPPPGAYGNIPTQRLPTQINQFDTAPSCVQNAMMTKDKKPFTYTPGGIDLSQIKSPRMAKRIARNAQNEGVTGQSRPSPLVKPNGTENGNHSPSISMGAAAMGMPFQVFPTPPPPQPQPKANGGIPPPPPPANLSAPSKPAGNNNRKSPTPQSFEPPPMGFRPEIKIPTNPMAALKKVPKPQEKNDFWVEEYKKERSKSPMVERNDSPQNNVSNYQQEYNQQNNVAPAQTEPQLQTQEIKQAPVGNGVSSSSSEAPVPNGNQNGEQIKENGSAERESIVTGTPIQKSRDEVDQGEQPIYRRSFENKAPSPSPQTSPQVFNNVSSSTPPPPSKVFQAQSPAPTANNEPSPSQSPAAQSSPKPIFNNVSPSLPAAQSSPKPIYSSVAPPVPSPTIQAQNQQSPVMQAQSPKTNMIYNNVSRDTRSPFNRGLSPQPQQQQQQQQFGSPIQQNSPPIQKNAQVGSIYIPPVPAENLAYKPTPSPSAVPAYIQQQPQQQSEENAKPRQSTPLRWMASRPNTKETPEWAKEDNVTPSSINRPQSMYKPQSYASNQPQTNQTNNNAKFSTTNTYQTVQSPPPAQANTGLKLQINNNVGTQPKERIIPIQLEQTPTKTPESPKFTNYSTRNQSSPANGSSYTTRNPNQFVDQGYNNFMNNSPMSPNGNQNQSRIIPIAVDNNHGDGPFNNPVRGPVSSGPVVIQNSSRGINASAPSGNTTPNQSKSFRILQKITSTEDGSDDFINQMNQPAELQKPHYSRQMMATPQQQTNNAAIEQLQRMQQNRESGRQGPPMKYPQPPTYVQQRSPYQNDNEQYIPPSQQQAPEPKIYTGSAIPSRSFKLLQAMTTPENAAEMEGSDVEQIISNDNSLQSLNSSSHFPSQSSFNSRPNSFCSGGTVTPNIILTASEDEGAQVVELLSHKLHELTQSSSSDLHFDVESIDDGSFYNKDYSDNYSDNYSEGSFDHIDVCHNYGDMMRSMKSLHNVNEEEDDESDFDEIHLEVIHEDLSIITEEDSQLHKSNDTLLSDGTMVDEENEVTVRLPLRLSFSKSQNDEDVATVEVGNSQYEDRRGRSLSITSEGVAEVVPNNEDEWKDVDDFWGTSNNEELQTERKSNYQKAMQLFSKEGSVAPIPEVFYKKSEVPIEGPTYEPSIPTTVENMENLEQEVSKKEEEWQEVDDFWGTKNTEEEVQGRKSNYKNAMSFFTTTIEENKKPEPEKIKKEVTVKDEPMTQRITTVEPEPVTVKEEPKDWQEVDDFWGNQNTEDDSNERRSNYRNARSFFASTIRENSGRADSETPKEKTPQPSYVEEKPWWENSVRAENENSKEKTPQPSYVEEKTCWQSESNEQKTHDTEEKPWWQIEGEAPVWLNTEDLSYEDPKYKDQEEPESDSFVFINRKDKETTPETQQIYVENVPKRKWWEQAESVPAESSNQVQEEPLTSQPQESAKEKECESMQSQPISKPKKWWETADVTSESNDTVEQKPWWNSDDTQVPKTVEETVQDNKIEEYVNEETISSKSASNEPEPKLRWWESKADEEINIKQDDIDTPKEPERKLRWWEVKEVPVQTEEKPWWQSEDSSKIEESNENKQEVTEVKESVKTEEKPWWHSEDSSKVEESNESKQEVTEVTAPSKGWWETEEEKEEVSKPQSSSKAWWESDNVQEDATEIISEQVVISNVIDSVKKESSCQVDVPQNTVENEEISSTKSWWEADDSPKTIEKEEVSSKGWWETDDSPKTIEKEQVSKGWWETDDSPNTIEKEQVSSKQEWRENDVPIQTITKESDLPPKAEESFTKAWWEADDDKTPTKEENLNIKEEKIIEEPSKETWWKSSDVPTTVEEKPWWETEGEAPVWLNTEDLQHTETIPKPVPEPKKEPTPEKEEIRRRSPSKAKEEISKRRSWWEQRETSVEPAIRKRFSMFEDDRKSLPKLEDLVPKKFGAEIKMKSIKERIQMLESTSNSFEEPSTPVDQKLLEPERGSLSRNSSQRSEIESEVDEDSGVTDMIPGNSSQQISETDDTESENFPELRKMSRYSRAATHSRLFKLLQDENEIEDNAEDEFKFKPSKKKIVHNVSITRRQKPELLKNAESMAQRRERLSLPLRKNTSIDNDNPSTPNSPRSPSISRASSTTRFIPKIKDLEEDKSCVVNEQLVQELVQSLLLKKDGAKLKNLPMEKLQAAAKRALEEQLDSLENTSIDSTPAITPSQDFNTSDYSDYYDSWRTSVEESDNGDYEIVPSKSFRRLQETSTSGKRLPLARCPRVLSSRNVNRDLARVTESPEIVRSSSERDSMPRCHSVSRWVKIS